MGWMQDIVSDFFFGYDHTINKLKGRIGSIHPCLGEVGV
jgi:hypothetical protein